MEGVVEFLMQESIIGPALFFLNPFFLNVTRPTTDELIAMFFLSKYDPYMQAS